MENMSSTESLYFDPATGKLCTSRPSNDKAIAVDMNKQGSGGFFGFNLGRHGTENGSKFDFKGDQKKGRIQPENFCVCAPENCPLQGGAESST